MIKNPINNSPLFKKPVEYSNTAVLEELTNFASQNKKYTIWGAIENATYSEWQNCSRSPEDLKKYFYYKIIDQSSDKEIMAGVKY
jgi:hypothetical protein